MVQVQIIEGKYEAFNKWVSVNLILNNFASVLLTYKFFETKSSSSFRICFKSVNRSQTMGLLDLNADSAQVAFDTDEGIVRIK